MGGVKRKSMASMEKQQDAQDEAQQPGAAPKGKKGTEKKSAPQQQKKLPFLAPKMTDQEMLKTLAPLKSITIFSASRALGVNSSIANTLIRTLESKKMLLRVGGFSGHYVWTTAK